MNLIPGRIVEENGHACFEGAGLRLRLLSAAPSGTEAVLGLRPEHLSDRPPAGPHQRLTLKVSVVELLGDRQDVYLTTPTQASLVGRLDARSTVREGDETVLYADLAHAHLFDGRSGDTLLLENQPCLTTAS